jgi:hypothetical protein
MPASRKRAITIRPDQQTWLEGHPEVNFSGQVQRWLDALIEAADGKRP